MAAIGHVLPDSGPCCRTLPLNSMIASKRQYSPDSTLALQGSGRLVRLLEFLVQVNYVIVARIAGVVVFLLGPFHVDIAVKILVTLLLVINLVPTVTVAFLASVSLGVPASTENMLVVITVLFDIAGWVSIKTAYTTVHGRPPSKALDLKPLNLYTGWFALIFFGVGTRILLVYLLFRQPQIIHGTAAPYTLGFLFVPSTECLWGISAAFKAGTLVRGIALVIGAMMDHNVYSELVTMRHRWRQQHIEDEWRRGLADNSND